MTELHRLADTIHRAYSGDAWHGPSLSEILEGVDAAKASQRRGDTHTIWELTLHIAAWLDIIRRRLNGENLGDHNLTWSDNWPTAPSEVTESKWADAKQQLQTAFTRLEETVLAFPASRLDENVISKDYSFSVMLHGAAQHALYHGGQIALLKKLLES